MICSLCVEHFAYIFNHSPMKEPTYRQALGHAWNLTWNHKLLWLLGLFAAMLGHLGLGKFFSKISYFSFSSHSIATPAEKLQSLKNIFSSTAGISLPAEGWVAALWLIIIIGAVLLFLLFVSTVSQGALIHSTAQSVRHKKLPSIADAWHAGVAHFWRVLALFVLRLIIFAGLSSFIAWAAVNAIVWSSGWDAVLFLIIFAIAALVGMIVTFLTVYAAGYVVVEEYSFLDAVHSAWHLFMEHRLVSLEVGLLLLLANAVFIALSAFGVLLFFLPAILLWIVALAFGSGALLTGGFVIGAIVLLMYIMLLGAIFSVFSTSAWTYLFMKMHKKGLVSRIHHWLTA